MLAESRSGSPGVACSNCEMVFLQTFCHSGEQATLCQKEQQRWLWEERRWNLSSTAASFPGHRRGGDVTADFSWRHEISHLVTDICSACIWAFYFSCSHNNHWRGFDEGIKVDVWRKPEFGSSDWPGRCTEELANRSCFALKTQKQQRRICDSLNAFDKHFIENRFKAEINNKMFVSGMKNYFGKIFWPRKNLKLDLVPDSVHFSCSSIAKAFKLSPLPAMCVHMLSTSQIIFTL